MPGEQIPYAADPDGATPRRGPLWERLRARLTGRPDTEHEQILVRVGIGVAIVSGLMIAAVGDPPPPQAVPLLSIASSYLVGGVMLLVHLLVDPAPRPARRYVGMAIDIVALTMVLLVGQGTAALFYPFYLWITLGMGFRYGRSYLLVSAVSSLLSFAVVIALTEYWRTQPALAGGLWVALLVLPAYALSLLTKLTDALARAEEANQAKSRFLATMSHELRTPLHAIIGMADLLRASPMRAEQQDMIRTVRSAGQTLLEMIGDLLDVAKIEAGSMTVQPTPFDLHALLATARALLHHQARDKGLELRLTIDPAVPYRLYGAARSLQQILVNLVTNAVKFTDAGHVTIRVLAEAVAPDKVALRIDVQDTGIGIPVRAQEHIFERFAQVDESATRRHGGTGLGLAIARQLANLMGGLLLVDSTPGVGSCFTFRAPFARTAAAAERTLSGAVVVAGEPAYTAGYVARVAAWGAAVASASRPEHVQALMARGGRPPALLFIDSRQWPLDLAALRECIAAAETEPPNVVLVTSREQCDQASCLAVLRAGDADERLFTALHAALAQPDVPVPVGAPDATSRRTGLSVLVAEDNRVNQQVIERMLSSAGHRVRLVSDGEQALQALEFGEFDVVLMDVNMPVMNGLDAVKLHRFATGDRDSPPFVALTADATEETRRECEEAGIAAYLTKPVDMEQLLGVIDRVTSRESSAGAWPMPDAEHAADGAVEAPSPLDPTHLERLRQLDDADDFLHGLIGDFIADAEQLVDELEAAALDVDAAAFRDRAHALRSSAAHLGATALFELCLRWRGIGPDELAAEGSRYALQLRSEFERLRDALMVELGRRAASGQAGLSPQQRAPRAGAAASGHGDATEREPGAPSAADRPRGDPTPSPPRYP
jgi:two-component system sensor histidine kinase RpfC